MAERKSQNKYYPPDWDPAIYGSINLMVKSRKSQKRPSMQEPGNHPREYGRKVRFEMPFSVWCDGCGNHIGMGVRYHALRAEVGKYLSTVIQRFRMKCHLCPNYFEIHTDPRNTAYKIISGCRQRIETFDPKDAEVMILQDSEQKERLENDAFYKLEHDLEDTKKAKQIAATIDEIREYRDITDKDPYKTSQILRQKFRTEKKAALSIQVESNAIRDKNSMSIPILPEIEQDAIIAKDIHWDEKMASSSTVQKAKAMEKPLFKPFKSKPTARSMLRKIVAKSRRGDPFSLAK